MSSEAERLGGARPKIGLSLGLVNPSLWVPLTELADELGFESVWLPEHLVFPASMSGSPTHGAEHPPVPPKTPVFDAFVYFAMLAGRTSRVRFGTYVYNLGLRHPFVTARAAMTLDVISGGRFEFGIGASWLAEEWEAAQLDFSTRGRRVDEALEICQRLWTEETVEHHGEFFDFGPVMFEPKPVQPGGPRVHVGGDGPAAMRRAARGCAGWVPMNHTLEQMPASIARLAEMREQAGREDRVEITFAGPVSGAADLDRYTAHGIDRLLVSPWASSKNAIASTTAFAEQYLR